MSIRIEHGGVTYFCESPHEAVALGRLLAPPTNGRGRPQPEANVAERNGNCNPAGITALVQSLREGPKRLLRLVLDAPNGEIETDALQRALDVHSSAYGGYLAAITKAARKAEIDPRTFFQRVNRTVAG